MEPEHSSMPAEANEQDAKFEMRSSCFAKQTAASTIWLLQRTLGYIKYLEA
jgi:hypothetical protein